MNWFEALYNKVGHDIINGVVVNTVQETTTAHNLETGKLIGIHNTECCVSKEYGETAKENGFIIWPYNSEWTHLIQRRV